MKPELTAACSMDILTTELPTGQHQGSPGKTWPLTSSPETPLCQGLKGCTELLYELLQPNLQEFGICKALGTVVGIRQGSEKAKRVTWNRKNTSGKAIPYRYFPEGECGWHVSALNFSLQHAASCRVQTGKLSGSPAFLSVDCRVQASISAM